MSVSNIEQKILTHHKNHKTIKAFINLHLWQLLERTWAEQLSYTNEFWRVDIIILPIFQPKSSTSTLWRRKIITPGARSEETKVWPFRFCTPNHPPYNHKTINLHLTIIYWRRLEQLSYTNFGCWMFQPNSNDKHSGGFIDFVLCTTLYWVLTGLGVRKPRCGLPFFPLLFPHYLAFCQYFNPGFRYTN